MEEARQEEKGPVIDGDTRMGVEIDKEKTVRN